jgi:alkanesulfonate monooxygenase SsuD/methylene tetrahydromethanopterin reductase-like flavin-dependent oxidoreductase (luciferase family)
MKLGVLQFFSWPERRVDLATVYDRAIQRIEIMDRSGYDAVWLAEHHFSSFSVCPSVHMTGTLAAARTRRLRIGTAVSLAAFYHPLRLAEEVALLDVLSGGRVNWGAGRGFSRGEFTAFGVPAEESTSRFRETVEIVLRAWSESGSTLRANTSGSRMSRFCRNRHRPHCRCGWRRVPSRRSFGRQAKASRSSWIRIPRLRNLLKSGVTTIRGW